MYKNIEISKIYNKNGAKYWLLRCKGHQGINNYDQRLEKFIMEYMLDEEMDTVEVIVRKETCFQVLTFPKEGS